MAKRTRGDVTNAEAIARKIVMLARSGERWAVELCFARLEGAPRGALEVSVQSPCEPDSGAYERLANKLARYITGEREA